MNHWNQTIKLIKECGEMTQKKHAKIVQDIVRL